MLLAQRVLQNIHTAIPNKMTYEEILDNSKSNPSKFWKEQSDSIEWFKKPKNIVSENQDGYTQWFEDGKLNLSYLCIDKHINDGFGEQIAIIYDSPVTNTIQKISFNELYKEVSRLARGLKDLGLNKGDTVIIYMPMIPQAMYAMLACARIGVIHSVVFGGFAPNELSIRIDDCKPKAIITASHGIETDRVIPYKPMVDNAIEISSHKPEKVILYKRKNAPSVESKEYDIDFSSLVSKSNSIEAVSLKSTHPSYILYTSGTTAKPKGVIRDTGGHATAMKFSMKHVYGVDEGETYWAASDLGWAVGHSYIVYGPLINRNTTILFEGKPVKTPDASTFWRVISDHKVKVMFTAPTAIRAIIKEDPKGELMKQYDLSCLKYQFLAGERSDKATLLWLEENLNIPVIDHWWQTESGSPMIANMVGIELMKVKHGSSCLPVCGYDIQILNEEGNQVEANEEGYLTIKLPLPPGALLGLWEDSVRFKESYLNKFDGYYFSGDGGYKDEDGYVYITGRVDDVINVAGHRLSTAEMEEIVASHRSVAECAVFGVRCEMKGQKPLALVVLKSNETSDQESIQAEIVAEVRTKIGAVASFRQVIVVQRLPKTRSGKILRKLLRNIADKEAYKIPSTIDDVAIIDEIKSIYKSNNI